MILAGADTPGPIDVTFDFRRDAGGKDPDTYSPTLRCYHKRLWSKRLPSEAVFQLTTSHCYLHHQSEIGTFCLSSDSVIPTFWRAPRVSCLFYQLPPEERDLFMRLSYTIGGMMIFPADKIGGKLTINGARGFNPRIKDRFDFTVECIRRYYLGCESPLRDTLERYRKFFALFRDFQGYVDFFHLQDIVTADYSEVRFFTPFTHFEMSPLPANIDVYRSYRQRAIDFIEARNLRISQSI